MKIFKIFILISAVLLPLALNSPTWAESKTAGDPVKPVPEAAADKTQAANDKKNEKAGKIEIQEFYLADSDILAWEQSGEGKYIYFTLTDRKNEELAVITEENLGKPLQINIEQNFIIIPEVTAVFDQKNGFVLVVPEENRKEMSMLLDPQKEKKATTALTLEADKKDSND